WLHPPTSNPGAWCGSGSSCGDFSARPVTNEAVTSPAPAARSRDAELAARCVQGDRAAQRELFQMARAAVHHTLYRILGSNQDMEDVLQETFLEVFRSMKRYAAR